MAGFTYSLTIRREDEEMVREAAKQINNRFNEFRERYKDLSSEMVVVMVAHLFAWEALGEKKRNDTAPYAGKIAELTALLDDYFREQK